MSASRTGQPIALRAQRGGVGGRQLVAGAGLLAPTVAETVERLPGGRTRSRRAMVGRAATA